MELGTVIGIIVSLIALTVIIVMTILIVNRVNKNNEILDTATTTTVELPDLVEVKKPSLSPTPSLASSTPSSTPSSTNSKNQKTHQEHIATIAQSAGLTLNDVSAITYIPPVIPATTNTGGANSMDSSATNTAVTQVAATAPSTASNLKKGFVAGHSDPTATAKISALNAGWYYTWGPTAPLTTPTNIKFTPMFWNVSKSTPSCSITNCSVLTTTLKLPSLGSPPPAGQDNVILGYNEPDGTNANAQGNMRVDQAVQFWPLISQTNRQRLGSPVMFGSLIHPSQNNNNVPAPSDYTPADNLVTYTINISNTSTPNNVTITPGQWDSNGNNVSGIWLDNFLYQLHLYNQRQTDANAKARYPDFICVHWYGPPNATSFLNYLKLIYAKYKLNIWVTEYSCADWNATCCTTTQPYSRLGYSNITQGSTKSSGFDWSYPTSSRNDSTNTNATARFMIDTVNGMNQLTYVERYCWKERFYLLPPGTTVPAGKSPTNYSLESSSNPDVMGQSTLFASFEHFPTTGLPPLTPLGQLYASL